MDSRVWDSLAAHFSEEKLHFIDLGFVDERKQLEITLETQKSIYITHSLGTLWALKHHSNNIAGLISINGFTNFTNFVDERTLITMQKHLKRNPEALMSSFWDNIELPENSRSHNLNIEELYKGLDYLINLDAAQELQALQIPILSLQGKKDRLLSNEKMEKELLNANININKDGGHILPISHTKWCANKIREFISEFRLEE